MAEVLRVEVHLVDASPVRPGDAWEPLGGDRADGVGGGALSGGSRASLEDGPAVARAPGRLPTGARVGGGFRPGRVVTRTPDGRTRLEWACRGPVLHHLRRIQEWAVRAIEVSFALDEERRRRPIREGEKDGDGASSSASPRLLAPRAVALVTLCTPTALWRRGKFEPKDARGRVAVADVFGHAAGFEVSPGAVSVGSRRSSDLPRAGFCGVLGCVTHDARRGKRGGLAASLENLKPPVPSPRPIQPARADAPCAADAGEDAIAVIAGFLDARSAACLAATCGGMRDRMDCHASGLSKTINLHPHQRAGLAWMRRRERPGRDGFVSDPRWRGPLRDSPSASEEKTFWVDVVHGALSSTAPPRFADAAGGLLCDEPGLGKTVTALALVLARRGARASPPPGFRARRCAETGGWYYAGAPRLAGAAHGDEDAPRTSATPGVGGPDARTLSRGSGPSASARRSKRSRSSTPTGHFAAMERAAFEFSDPNSKAKKRRKSAAAAAEGLGAPKVLFPASSSRLGPGAESRAAGFLPGSASAPSLRRETEEAALNDIVSKHETTSQNPPLGFVSLSASSRAAQSEGVTSRCNVAFFRRAMDAARRAVGLDPVEDVVEFILMNRGGNALVTNDDPLLLPKWRFGDDPRPARVLFELGLRPASAPLARLTPKDWVWVPPGEAQFVADASAGTPCREETETSEEVECAFDVESLDEARSLAREGADVERDLDARVYLSRATLVVLPPVLISHWLEQIHFVTGGALDGPSVCVVGGGIDADGGPLFSSFGNHQNDGSDDARWLFGVSPENVTPGATPGVTTSRDADENDLFATARARKRTAHASLPSFEGLSSAALASRWDIVLMPSNRLSTEFSRVDSPLLRVHWARVVLDEGHQMGGAAAITAKLSMACALKAHARWVMTGTPTPATLKGAGVGHLQPLLAFLKDAPFGVSQTAWTNAIQKPLERFGSGGSKRGGAKGAVAGTTRALNATQRRDKKGGPNTTSTKEKGVSSSAKGKGKQAIDDDAEKDGASSLAARLCETAAEDECARLEAAARLGTTLRRVAIRTLKSDIRLPPLRRTVTLLPFTKRHARAYNELVAFLRRGLLLADWADPNHVESLLNVRQTRLASEAVTNLREAACVTGEFPVTCFSSEIDETIDDLTEALTRRNPNWSSAIARQKAEALRYPLANHRGACGACGAESFMPMLTPCAHLLCSACVAVVPEEGNPNKKPSLKEKEKESDFLHETRAPVRCPVCASAYVMQGVAPREDNPAPRRAVPQDLIEIQPSYVQHAWRMTDALEAQGESTKVEHLLSRLRAIGAAPSLQDRARERVEELGVEAGAHGDAMAAAAALGSPFTDGKLTTTTWRWVRPSHKAPPPKCIVYSGFRTHLAVIDLGLTGAGVNFENIARMGMTRSQKDAALASFRADDQVAVLLLDRAAAEGLDLSFASRVFVMEPLDNASLEQQVVSRAHRMGQRETVQVEVLAMAGTAEETLLDVQAELAAAAAAEAAEAATRKKRSHDDASSFFDESDESDSDESDSEHDEDEEGGAEGRIAAAALFQSESNSFGNENAKTKRAPHSARDGDSGGVAPSAAAEALSRRRVLQSLRLVPVPSEETEEDRRVAAGEGDDVAAERAAAANAAANVEANRLAAIAATTAAARTREVKSNLAGDPAPSAAPRRRGVTFADDEEAPPAAAPAPPARGSRGWTVRVRARAVGADGAPLALEIAPVHVRLPLGGATTAAKLRDATAKALGDALETAGVEKAADSVEALFLAPESLGLSGSEAKANQTIAIPLDGGALFRLGVEDRASLEATIRVAKQNAGRDRDPDPLEEFREISAEGPSADGRRLGGSPAATGVGGIAGGLPSRGSVSFGTGSKSASGRSPTSGTFRGKKQRLGSGKNFAGVAAFEDAPGAPGDDVATPSASAASSARIFSSSSPARAGRVLDADALDRRVARRVASVAAADDVSSAAMLRDPDGADGADGLAFAGVPSASAMSLDLLRAAEASSARGAAADATVSSLQSVFRSVVAERLAEAEGNAKVSSALAGGATFTRLRDGRLLVRFRDASAGGKEKTDVVADLPSSVLPFVLHAVAADARTNPSARANLAPAAMAVASPRVFWAVVRHGNVGGPGGIGFAEAMNRLAPGAADWEALARRTRAAPERYNEYVSH